MTAARHLRIIAGDTAVPALQAMLADERGSDMALYALQKIPGAAAEKALSRRSDAGRPDEDSMVAALGERRTSGAVPALAPLLKTPASAGAAATALGSIGSDAAQPGARPGACLRDRRVEGGGSGRHDAVRGDGRSRRRTSGALRIYEAILADAALPASTHRAAALGRISAAGDGAQAALLDVPRRLRRRAAAGGRR